LAYVAATGYDIGDSAQLDNHAFEVVTRFAYHLDTTTPDVDPSLVLADALSDTRSAPASLRRSSTHGPAGPTTAWPTTC
jgi:hypothetical protein